MVRLVFIIIFLFLFSNNATSEELSKDEKKIFNFFDFNKDKNIHIDYLNEQRDIEEEDDNIYNEIICKIARITENNEDDLELFNRIFIASPIALGAIAFLPPFIMLMQLCLNNTENQDGIELSNANSIGNTRPEPEEVEENQFSPETSVAAGSTYTLAEGELSLSQSV